MRCMRDRHTSVGEELEHAMGIYTGSLFRRGRIHKPEPTSPVANADKPAVSPCLSVCDGRSRCERQASFKRGAISAVDSIALSPFR